MTRNENIGTSTFTAARTGARIHVSTIRYAEPCLRSPYPGIEHVYLGETLITAAPAGHHQDYAAWHVVALIRYSTTVEAVDGHRAIVKRGRQSRRRAAVRPDSSTALSEREPKADALLRKAHNV